MSVSLTAKRRMSFLSLVLVFVVIMSTEARAEPFGFYAVTTNNMTDVAAGEAQLWVDVIDLDFDPVSSSDQVLFNFYNDDTIPEPKQMFFRNVYFYDGMLELPLIIPTPGVAFSEPSNPQDLPGYDSGLLTTFLAADADTQPEGTNWGVNPGEYLSVRFNIINPYNYDTLLSDIASSNVVLGLKVQGFDGGGSESFITPIPASVILGMLGLGIAGLKLRKFA